MGLVEVGHGLHEAERDQVGANLQRIVEILTVLFRQRGDRQCLALDGEPLAIAKFSRQVGFHDRMLPRLDDLKDDHAVIAENPVADVQRAENFRVGNRNGFRLVCLARSNERVGAAKCQLQLAVRKVPDADLRALQVRQHRKRAADGLFRHAHRLKRAAMVFMAAMAEVQPENIRTRFSQELYGSRAPAAGSERGDDLRISSTKTRQS